jgi:TRAP-type mannitol/chloroaromatic compound transport system substrate-binding protein
VKTPESVLKAQLASWDKVVEAQSADPFFKKVVESQKAWAKRVVGFSQEYVVDPKIAFEHIFKA